MCTRIKAIKHKNCKFLFTTCTRLNVQTISTNTMDIEQTTKRRKLEDVEVLKEGQAEILVANKNVFYNPVQEFNRDLSIAVLTVFADNRANECETKKSKHTEYKTAEKGISDEPQNEKGITILDALSATGLRSIRYAKEIQGIKQIVANDISAKAVESIKKNIFHNQVENTVVSNHDDATMLMYQRRNKRFDAIDLDPYGCPSIFLDGAVQCVSDGGLLLVTATDMAVLAGNSAETCYVKYGAMSLKSKACHEIALRILLQTISSHAGRYGRYIVPLLSISADFYIRVFVKLYSSQIKCKDNATKIGLLYQCTGCESLNIQTLAMKKTNCSFKLPNTPVVDQHCKYCQHRHHVGGPMWLGPLHDQEFVAQLLCSLEKLNLGTLKRIEGVLSVVHEELDTPLYYTLDRLMSIVRCHTPPMVMFRSALLNAGYKVSYSHANKISIKTDAPNDVIWDVVRAWEKDNPSKREKFPENSPGLAILNASSSTDVSFQLHTDANPISRQRHLSRFQVNPTVNWGPGTRSKMSNLEVDPKKLRNQNKKRQKSEQAANDDENKNVEVTHQEKNV